VYRDPDMLRYVSGEPLFFANGVSGCRLRPEDADRRIDETVAFFETQRVPWAWWASPATMPADIEARLLARGFHVEEDTPRYAAEIEHVIAEGRGPEGLVRIRVGDEETQQQWLDVMGRGFDQDEHRRQALAKAAASAGFDPASPWVRFLGVLDGQPVASSGLILAAGLAGIINVATVPEARGQGIRTAMTQVALTHAREAGYRVAVLGASDMGASLYEHMGFQRVGWSKACVR
jgi:GNAT superfamily N-acetyltransferase